MHHALEIQEILSSIFYHFTPNTHTFYCDKPDASLFALARTCRAFKEPALDALWMCLQDLSPLAGCLPKESYRLRIFNWHFVSRRGHRSLTQADWNTLRSYTRRVRCIYSYHWTHFPDHFALRSHPPTTEPLFPNLRYLRCRYDDITRPLLNLPLPSLTFLYVTFANPRVFRASLESFPRFSPGITDISFYIENDSGDIVRNYICHRKNLCSVQVYTVLLDTDDLLHLSRMPTLTKLEFSLRETLRYFDSPTSFPNLQLLKLNSGSLGPISQLLSQIRLPALTVFSARLGQRPLRQELGSLLAGVLTSNAGHRGHTIQEFRLIQYYSDHVRSEALRIDIRDLRPLIAFGDLRKIEFNIECNVCLTERDLLTLVPAWPKLQELRINTYRGWNSHFGITPSGLVRILEACTSLTYIALRLDVRGYTNPEVFSSQAPENGRATLLPKVTSINVLDAAIDAESVPAVTTLFSSIAVRRMIVLEYWDAPLVERLPNAKEYLERWNDVRARILKDTHI